VRGILVVLVPIVEADVPALLVTHTSEALAQWCESGRIVVEANVEEPDSRDLRLLLPLGGERRKSESENDREPDPSHEHLGWDGWRESSRPEIVAACRIGVLLMTALAFDDAVGRPVPYSGGVPDRLKPERGCLCDGAKGNYNM
jgi:hypothetical protein